ncbi:MAG: DUF167 domain-containing protein [Acidimicrobiia bacterium]
MEHDAIRMSGEAVTVDVLVVPNASSTQVVGRHGDRVRLRVSTAPEGAGREPEGGKANRAVEKLLVDATGAERAEIVSGASSRTKTVRLWGVVIQDVHDSLLES